MASTIVPDLQSVFFANYAQQGRNERAEDNLLARVKPRVSSPEPLNSLERTNSSEANKGANLGLVQKAFDRQFGSPKNPFLDNNPPQDANQLADRIASQVANAQRQGVRGIGEKTAQALANAEQSLAAVGVAEGDRNAVLSKIEQSIQSQTSDFNQLGLSPSASPRRLAEFASQESLAFSRKSFSFELETLEGDKISISASDSRASASRSSELAFSNGPEAFYAGASSSLSLQSSRYALSVEGDLNTEELAALEQLFGQVEALTEVFFQGETQTAFEQALALNFDSSQIAEFSLNLRQTDVRQAVGTYAAVGSNAPSQAEAATPAKVGSLKDFIDRLANTLDSASSFKNPAELANQLFAQLLENQQEVNPQEQQKELLGALALTEKLAEGLLG